MKLRTTLTKRFVVAAGVATLLTAVCCCVATWFAFSEQAHNDLANYSSFVEEVLDENNQQYPNPNIKLMDDYRITVVDKDGKVLYESNRELEKDEMGNHNARPEIRQALAEGKGESSRYSNSVNKVTYYYAVKMDNGNVLRIGKTVQSIFSLYGWILFIVLSLGIYVVLFSLLLAGRLSKKIVEPFSNMKFDNKDFVYEELKPFADTIAKQQRKIKKQFDDLQEQRDRITTLIANMREGFIMLDVDKVILVENGSAKKLLKTKHHNNEGKNILEVYQNDTLLDSVNKASKGESTVNEVKLNKKTVKLYVSPVYTNGEVVGVICLLLDITAQKKTEKLRREFTANVTHELKTPLTSISGYAEMIENGMVTEPEDMQKFAGRIHKEAGRLISLIGDIMRLSKMDDKAYQIEGVKKVNLKDTVEEAVETLEMSTRKNNITIETNLQDVTVTGNETQLFELVYNLCDNAIRYNKPNGKVYITLKTENESPVLVVKDTGIGIEKKHKERIFERFYRVDKSRSKETGGTGLGLAIVKHIAEIHNAKIKVDSTVGEETEITVTFYPKEN